MRWYAARHVVGGLDLEAGTDAVTQGWRSTWWEWTDGSRPFHWRWPQWYRSIIRDGLPIYFRKRPPNWKKPQSDDKRPDVKAKVVRKLGKVRARRYIDSGHVTSLTSFFAVPKGEDDIRMVYDGTASGLNDAMWVPRFGMSTLETHFCSLEPGTHMADVDVG